MAERVFLDCDFYFNGGGAPCSFTIEEGRDVKTFNEFAIDVTLHPSPETIENYIITRSHIDYQRIIRRVVKESS